MFRRACALACTLLILVSGSTAALAWEGPEAESRPKPVIYEGRPTVVPLSEPVVVLRPLPRPVDVPELLYDARWLDARAPVEGDATWRCLTEALYFEARGEGARGQFAVAEVILNRVDSGRFPDTVCAVIRQGTGRKWQCQFTYTCDGLPETVYDRRSWATMGKIARLALDGAPRSLTHGALFYHARYVSPSWSRVFYRTASIGEHHFYSPEAQLASN